MLEAQHGVVQAEPGVGQAGHARMPAGDPRRGDAELIAEKPDRAAAEGHRRRAVRAVRRTVMVEPGGEGGEGIGGRRGQSEGRDRIKAKIGYFGARIVRGRAVEERQIGFVGAGGETVERIAPG